MTTFQIHRRRGLTWVELIVVLAIIAVLVALLLPSVEQARGAARRTQCKNNLKQIGLALHNYHDAFNSFPPGFIVNPNGPYQGWSWSIHLLPYVDSGPIYTNISGRFGDGLQSLPDLKELKLQLAAFNCPTRPDAPKDPHSGQIAHSIVSTNSVIDGVVAPGTVDWKEQLGRSTYFGNAGYLQAVAGGIPYDGNGGPPSIEPYVNAASLGFIGTRYSPENRYCDQTSFRGIFGQNSWVKISDIADGTSNTLMVGERYIPNGTASGTIGHGTWVGVPDCTRSAGLAMALGDTSIRLNAGLRSHAQTTGFASEHTGGAHFLLADGSVRFLSENIDIGVYRDLSTIDDGRSHSEF